MSPFLFMKFVVGWLVFVCWFAFSLFIMLAFENEYAINSWFSNALIRFEENYFDDNVVAVLKKTKER